MLVFKARPRKDPSLSSALTPSQRRMMRTLREAREATQRALRARQAEIMRLLLHAPSSQIVRAVPTDKWLDVQAELGAELQAELIDAGRRVKLPPIQKATINYRFDDTRPEAAAWAAKEAGTLIQDITQDQLTFVRDVISRSELGEFTPVEAARVFRQMEDGMGLTTQQSQWVENFRQQRITEGMERGLSYEAAEAASAKATGKYADRIYRYRTETIARTEIMRASNEGRNQAWAQGIEGGWIAPDSLKKWSVEIDGRECSICRPLGDLDPIPINASFPQGDPPVHPNCRCTVQLTDEVPQDIRDMTDEELDAEIDRLLSDRQAIPAGEETQAHRTASRFPDEELSAKRDEASRLRAEAREAVDGSVGWSGPDPDKYPEAAAKWERADALDREAREQRTAWLDSKFRTQTGSRVGNEEASEPFTPEGQKYRDRYVVDDPGTLKMNANLRAGKGATARVKGVDAMIAEHSVTEPIVTYRGSILPPEVVDSFQPGTTFTDRGFQSSDVQATGALRYAASRTRQGAQGQTVLFEMVVTPETKAAYVGYGEVVIGRDATMDVIGVRDEDGVRVVEVVARHA